MRPTDLDGFRSPPIRVPLVRRLEMAAESGQVQADVRNDCREARQELLDLQKEVLAWRDLFPRIVFNKDTGDFNMGGRSS